MTIKFIFHIGRGKTGTTSIQKTLREYSDELAKQGFWYLGNILQFTKEL